MPLKQHPHHLPLIQTLHQPLQGPILGRPHQEPTQPLERPVHPLEALEHPTQRVVLVENQGQMEQRKMTPEPMAVLQVAVEVLVDLEEVAVGVAVVILGMEENLEPEMMEALATNQMNHRGILLLQWFQVLKNS